MAGIDGIVLSKDSLGTVIKELFYIRGYELVTCVCYIENVCDIRLMEKKNSFIKDIVGIKKVAEWKY